MSLDDWQVGFIADTNKGGVPVKVCSCGVLCLGSMARKHAEQCAVYLAEQANEQETPT